jgi:alternate signal-mediated exported protein
MNKATKGALAAVAAGTLMLGGAGTLAYWTGTSNVTGTAINSGKLTISNPDCTTEVGAHEWQLDGVAFTAASDKVVPGDTLSKVCDIELVLVGNNIGAELEITEAAFAADNDLTAELDPDASFTVDNVATTTIDEPGTYAVRVTIDVPFDGPAATNDSQDLAAALDNITVTATQTHDA